MSAFGFRRNGYLKNDDMSSIIFVLKNPKQLLTTNIIFVKYSDIIFNKKLLKTYKRDIIIKKINFHNKKV